MGGELVDFPRQSRPVDDRLLARLEKLSAIFAAIDAGELLAAFPDCPHARKNHTTALNLLSIVEVEIRGIRAELAE